MKSTKLFLICFLVVLTTFGLCQPTNDNSHLTFGRPTAESTVIVTKSKEWTVEQLNERALKVLQEKAGMPIGLDCEVVTKIYLDNKKTMCEFMYLQGFGKPLWIVKIGFDGEVASFRTSIAREGGHKR